MAIIIDIIIVLIFAISLYVGYKRGFVKTMFAISTLIAAILLAACFGNKAGFAIRKTATVEKISYRVTEELSDCLFRIFEEKTTEDKKQENVAMLDILLTDFGVDTKQFVESYENALTTGAENVKKTIVSELSDTVMDALCHGAGTILVFVVSYVLLKIAGYVLDKVFKLPILKTANKTGGLLLGVVSGAFSVFIFCIMIDIIAPYVPVNPILYVGMENDTYIYKYILDFSTANFLFF